MLILNAQAVRQCLPMPTAIAAMKEAFAALSGGAADVPARTHLEISEASGVTLVMPSRLKAEPGALGVKVVSVFNQNPQRGLPRIQAAMLVIDPQTGTPLALLEGSTLTAIRTAAASGAATDVLARRDSYRLAIIGAGVEARTHLLAMCAVRPISETRVVSRTRGKADQFVADMTDHPDVTGRVIAVDTAAEAVASADIVCTVTTSRTPVFEPEHVRPGTHINAVGSFQPDVVEIPAETVAAARVVVDSRSDCWEEAGDLIQAVATGRIAREHVLAELGELVAGSRTERRTDSDITLFKSVGVAIQDAVAARCVLQQAQNTSAGMQVDWQDSD